MKYETSNKDEDEEYKTVFIILSDELQFVWYSYENFNQKNRHKNWEEWKKRCEIDLFEFVHYVSNNNTEEKQETNFYVKLVHI